MDICLTPTVNEIISHIRGRLSDNFWLRTNTQHFKDSGSVYWYFAFVGELTDTLREELHRYFIDMGFGTVVVRSYAEHFNGKGGFMIYLFIDEGVTVPVAIDTTVEKALS